MKKTIIVTGASKGIGKGIAEEFAGIGYNVALLSRHYDGVRKVAWEIPRTEPQEILPFECDVSDLNRVQEVFARIHESCGGIDILVNNAGTNARRALVPTDIDKWFKDFPLNLEGWNAEILVNLTGVYICSYAAAGYMIKQGSGGMINISSIKGKEPTSGPGYGASKAGVIKLTRDFAKALAPCGIRVNCIAPGFIDTGMTAELPENKKQQYLKQIPMERFGQIAEVAKVTAFLASDNASYITGATIDVNGGYLMD
jgi:3-oxoacyl-[acyl-carrier protein] reductase